MSYAGQVEVGSGVTSPVASTLYGICNTAAATAAKVVTLSDYDELITGTTVHVKFTYSNTAASPTMQVGSTAAKPIYQYATTTPGTTEATSWKANSVVSFTYDGTAWRMNDYGANAAIIAQVEGKVTTEATTRASEDTGIRNVIAPAYSSSSTYRKNQMVMYNKNVYVANQDITTAEAWTSGHWTQTTVAAQREYKLTFTNVSVAANSFVSNATYAAYPWRASVALTAVKSTMIPEVVFNLAAATSGNFAPIAECYNGGVYIYAAQKPTAATTLATVICWG